MKFSKISSSWNASKSVRSKWVARFENETPTGRMYLVEVWEIIIGECMFFNFLKNIELAKSFNLFENTTKLSEIFSYKSGIFNCDSK